MNCKLEKFWNFIAIALDISVFAMNCKLEKFWNATVTSAGVALKSWTVNLKSFEITNNEQLEIVPLYEL